VVLVFRGNGSQTVVVLPGAGACGGLGAEVMFPVIMELSIDRSITFGARICLHHGFLYLVAIMDWFSQ
jgi:glycerate kinase